MPAIWTPIVIPPIPRAARPPTISVTVRQGSGATPGDRATLAGYPHREVLENVSIGFAGLADAMDGLMSAIYHRLTFLDLTADGLGATTGDRSRVFLLGRRDLGRVCKSPPAGATFRTPVDCMGGRR